MKIMIIDDMKINANILEFYVKKYFEDIGKNIDIDIFESPDDAYYALTKDNIIPYELIFLDIMMPYY